MRYCFALICLVFALVSSSSRAWAGEIEHSIIWIIDGLSTKVLDTIELPNIKRLASQGAYYKSTEGIAPYHPNQGLWLRYHSSSIPNPVLLAGTLFINDQTEYVHQIFQKQKKATAHSTNSAYFSINDGFTYSYVDDTGKGTDKDALDWARQFLERGKPSYVRIHMQDLGRAARASYNSKGSPPWEVTCSSLGLPPAPLPVLKSSVGRWPIGILSRSHVHVSPVWSLKLGPTEAHP